MKQRRTEGLYLGNLGLAYAALGEHHKAIEYYEQGLAIYHELDDRQSEGNALGNLGNAYDALGETRKAIEYLERSAAIAHQITAASESEGEWIVARRYERTALGDLGLTYAALGESHKAIEYYVQSLAIARELGDRRGEGIALSSLGLAYAALGESYKAIKYHE